MSRARMDAFGLESFQAYTKQLQELNEYAKIKCKIFYKLEPNGPTRSIINASYAKK